MTNDPTGNRFYTLKNGLAVILPINTKEPRIAVRIAVRTGCKEQPLLWNIENLYAQYNSTKDNAKRRVGTMMQWYEVHHLPFLSYLICCIKGFDYFSSAA